MQGSGICCFKCGTENTSLGVLLLNNLLFFCPLFRNVLISQSLSNPLIVVSVLPEIWDRGDKEFSFEQSLYSNFKLIIELFKMQYSLPLSLWCNYCRFCIWDLIELMNPNQRSYLILDFFYFCFLQLFLISKIHH